MVVAAVVERELPGLAGAFADEPAVVAAWLFGSVAAGRAAPWSDVDFAVLLNQDAPRGLDRLVLLDAIAQRLARILDLPESDVDVVALDEQGPVFQHTVLRTGRLVYERDPKVRIRFYCSVVRRYFDFKPTLDIFDRAKYGRRR